MDKLKVAVVGVGSIAQVVHVPILKNMEDVELVAICDVDEAKVNILTEKFEIPRGYFLIDNLIKEEKLDAIFICTTNLYHYPMSYLALSNGIDVFVEKPIALNSHEAEKLYKLAEEKNLTAMVGMQNRFRDDVLTLKEFIEKDELGEIFYIKAGWLKKWMRSPAQSWLESKDYAGGGVLIDLGSQLIDLALYLTGLPKIKKVRLLDYKLNPDIKVEEAALAVIETESHMSITVEISWRMHLENDMIYTHLFGKKGAAYLNPLRINKELHGNLVNVTPVVVESKAERYKKSYKNEINHFIEVVKGEEKNQSSAKDAFYIMKIIDALYESGKRGQEVSIG
jgi:predicted dehydrogenase